MRKILLCISLLAVACGTGRPAPVDVTAEDMCEHCRMAISEVRFAAELIDSEGTAHKFDDLACMKSYLQDRKSDMTMPASFVMDYETRIWVAGREATYVRSQEFKTPMAGGIVAFKDRRSAEKAALSHKGALLSFHEVFE